MAIKFQKEPMNAHSSIKHVIGVVSGKGGVGKSFVTASMAAAMRKKGYEVGIMDADITGPSIPKMYGIHGKAVGAGKAAALFPRELRPPGRPLSARGARRVRGHFAGRQSAQQYLLPPALPGQRAVQQEQALYGGVNGSRFR